MKTLITTLLLTTSMYAADITLSWNDNSDNEVGFEVWCKLGSDEWKLIGATYPNTATWTDLLVPVNEVIQYKVRAWNEFGDSGFTNTVSINARKPQSPTALKGKTERGMNDLSARLIPSAKDNIKQ